jgi:hypothetical protein
MTGLLVLLEVLVLQVKLARLDRQVILEQLEQ